MLEKHSGMDLEKGNDNVVSTYRRGGMVSSEVMHRFADVGFHFVGQVDFSPLPPSEAKGSVDVLVMTGVPCALFFYKRAWNLFQLKKVAFRCLLGDLWDLWCGADSLMDSFETRMVRFAIIMVSES